MAGHDDVIDWIETHRDDIESFALDLANVPSPRGHEREAGDFVYDWLDASGIRATRQPVLADRANVIGTLPGRGGGESLLLDAHLDTAHGNHEEDRWIVPERHRVFEEAWRDGDYLIGDDVVNDKGPLAATLWAALALQRAGVTLEGDLHVAGVVGEIGGAVVDEHTDHDRLAGTGIGTRELLDGGFTSDHAIVAEATDYAIARMEAGVAWFRIRLRGTTRYQPLIALPDGDRVVEDHPGVLPAAARAALAIEEWAVGYREANTVEYDHGTMRPTAGVGAIRSGQPYVPSKAPGIAALYVDVRLPPGKRPEFVRDDLESVLADLDVEGEVDCYMFRRGYVAADDAVEPIRRAVDAGLDRVRDGVSPRPSPASTSMWRDFNVLAEVGVPCVMFGPPRSTPPGWEQANQPHPHSALHVDDLVDATKVYALAAMDLCGVAD